MNQSHQTPSADAWSSFVARSADSLTGVVSGIAPFGTFVRFDEGVDGLIPEVESTRRLNVGDQVTVRVLELDPEQRRVSLRQV